MPRLRRQPPIQDPRCCRRYLRCPRRLRRVGDVREDILLIRPAAVASTIVVPFDIQASFSSCVGSTNDGTFNSKTAMSVGSPPDKARPFGTTLTSPMMFGVMKRLPVRPCRRSRRSVSLRNATASAVGVSAPSATMIWVGILKSPSMDFRWQAQPLSAGATINR
jgi:hypothetical protein